jgi:hypothetical protein
MGFEALLCKSQMSRGKPLATFLSENVTLAK